MKKKICLILYYGFARFLPRSSKSQISKKIRYFLCRNIFKTCGVNVNVERGAWFGKGDKIEIGDNSGIGVNCRIHNNTIIGKDVMMGPECFFLESTHSYDRTDIPLRLQSRIKERVQVIIEDDVWIGREVLIIGNKTIKKGTIIGARTLLTKSFPEYSVIGGNPSRLIRNRLEKASS
ncbi:acyltransferase [Chryseobacterium hispalense]|uniref:acyltransferase n=1 Tax=Chryseobacterium hispalense TaxID=1453492 RepID=UPI003919535D